ncbi:MAG TPA: amino acid adenylation domain-containing protein, partial [Clostridia bacterium]|nr:amino acid adenylation domain-containing protein [Clostridia bacterium]
EIEGIGEMMGLFINTIPVRVSTTGISSFCELLQSMMKQAIERKKYDFLPLIEIQACTPLKNRIFSHILVFENYPVKQFEKIDDPIISVRKIEVFEETQYDFNLVFIPGNELKMQIDFNGAVLDSEFVKALTKHFRKIAKVCAKNPFVDIREICILTEEEKEKIIKDFGNTASPYPFDKTIDAIFEAQVDRYPEKVACMTGSRNYKYIELEEKANSLAWRLKAEGVVADSAVAIFMERSYEMIVGIYGVLKAGGTYLPIEPSCPRHRVEYILADSKAKILLTLSGKAQKVNFDGTILCLDREETYDNRTHRLERTHKPSDLAYIIYTSGSTGSPKGVMVEHRSIINIIYHLQNRYPLLEDQVYLMKTSFTFDVSIAEIFGWFPGGGSLAILEPGGEKDPEQIVNAVIEFKVTHMNFVPSMLNVFMDSLSSVQVQGLNGTVKYVFSAGEALSGFLINKFYDLMKGPQLINLYGPTESTVYASGCEISHKDYGSAVPIGKPVANTRIYILNSYEMLQPVGVSGELCIAGDGLARGYLNHDDLNAEKFIRPIVIDEEKLYRTGDLARWTPDGIIEYLGRIDQQVKIRGYRIELGEIESVIRRHEAVEDTVVCVEENEGNKYICAYVVFRSQVSSVDLKNSLAEMLPEYMLPSLVIPISQVPFNTSGKVDRKALPKAMSISRQTSLYTAPESEMEKTISAIWENTLGAVNVGIDDSFFDLGGDSIKAIQIISRMKKHDLYVDIKDLFKRPTIRSLAEAVRTTGESKTFKSHAEEYESLTAIQEWFFGRQFTDMHHWNQSVMLYRRQGFDLDILNKAFVYLTDHHDALRMRFIKDSGGIKQGIKKNSERPFFSIDVFEINDTVGVENVIKETANRLQAGIDIFDGPLVKIGLFKTLEGDHLLIVIHHLVIDGISWRILFEDFKTAYENTARGLSVVLPHKSACYLEWARSMRFYSKSDKLKEEVHYWKSVLQKGCIHLPVDRTITDAKLKDMDTIKIAFTEEETERLLRQTHIAYHTEINDILLSALGMTLKGCFGNGDKYVVTLEGHGRERLAEDLDINRTVGWFTSIYPVLIDVGATDLASIIKTVKEGLRKIPDKGVGFNILRTITSGDKTLEKELSYESQVLFNYLGQFDQDIDSSLFEISRFSDGQPMSLHSERVNKIELVGMVVGNKLSFSLSYHRVEYLKETMERFIGTYRLTLLKIIDHCLNKETSQLTPSDLGEEELTLEEFEGILNDIEFLS